MTDIQMQILCILCEFWAILWPQEKTNSSFGRPPPDLVRLRTLVESSLFIIMTDWGGGASQNPLKIKEKPSKSNHQNTFLFCFFVWVYPSIFGLLALSFWQDLTFYRCQREEVDREVSLDAPETVEGKTRICAVTWISSKKSGLKYRRWAKKAFGVLLLVMFCVFLFQMCCLYFFGFLNLSSEQPLTVASATGHSGWRCAFAAAHFFVCVPDSMLQYHPRSYRICVKILCTHILSYSYI